LRGETQTHLRINQLRRAVERGATLVASSRSASHEVISVLGVARSRVVVVPPAVPRVDVTRDGTDLVVNITGVDGLFVAWAPQLIDFAAEHGSRVVALASTAAAQKIRSSALAVTIRARHDARDALANARVVLHLSDGARFPSFAIAALSAGVPTLARMTDINRELLEGAAALVADDRDVRDTLEEVWTSDSRRSIMVAAGRSRAVDFAPDTAARAYLSLYHEVVRGWTARSARSRSRSSNSTAPNRAASRPTFADWPPVYARSMIRCSTSSASGPTERVTTKNFRFVE
jgi:hypothetical protein